MAESQEDLVNWSISKAEEYLNSARDNLSRDRYFVAAEEIFRSIETSLEALLYKSGIKRIEYPGTREKFTGRLALQFLVRDNLVAAGKLDSSIYNKYLELASALHLRGYRYGKFTKKDLEKAMEFAEELFYKAKAQIRK